MRSRQGSWASPSLRGARCWGRMGKSGRHTPGHFSLRASEKATPAAWGQTSEGCDSDGLDGTNERQEGSLGLLPKSRPRI